MIKSHNFLCIKWIRIFHFSILDQQGSANDSYEYESSIGNSPNSNIGFDAVKGPCERQNLFGSSYSSSSSSSEGSSTSLPKGQWVWNQSADNGKGKWEWSTATFQESHFSVTKASETQGSGRSSGDESYTSFASGKDSTGNHLPFTKIFMASFLFNLEQS